LNILERSALFAGILLYAGLLYQIGPATLMHDVSLVGAGFLLIFAQEQLAILFNTLGWRYAIPVSSRDVGVADLCAMRLAGDAVNYATPTAGLGGEFVKARLLMRRIRAPAAIASVSVSVINQFVGQLAFLLISAPFILRHVQSPDLNAVAAVVAVFAAIAFAAVRYGMRNRHSSATTDIPGRWSLLSRHRTRIAAAWHDCRAQLVASVRHQPFDLAFSVLYFTLGWAMGVVEVVLILYFLRVPIGWDDAIAIEGLSILVDMSFFFVPAKIGTQEGGKYLIFLLLGMDPAVGLALGVIRRLRELCWTFIGLLALGHYQVRDLRSRPAQVMATLED
jgi:uncharacterized protein (TIRG00374 family)